MLKAKHAHGSRKNLESAIANKVVDNFDVLFLSGEDENPAMGWLDKSGNPIILSPADEVAKLETQVEAELATKANAEEVETALASKADAEKVETLEEQVATKADAAEVETKLAEKADAEKVETLETELANKVSAEEVDAKVETAVTEKVESAVKAEVETAVEAAVEAKVETAVKAEVEAAVETKVGKYTSRMYEIAKVPDGTLVDYFDKEIRVMIPSSTDFANLDNGIAGAENMRYIECRVYAPEGAVKYRFNFGGTVGEGNVEDFANCTDEHGRIYIATAPIIAYYDAGSAAWVYYGANSTTKHYIGWNHTAEWLNENGVVIASNSVKINLSNEDCHYAVEPYYVGEMMTDVEAMVNEMVEEKIKEIEIGNEIIEF